MVGKGKGLRGVSVVQVVAGIGAATGEPVDEGNAVIFGEVIDEGVGVCNPRGLLEKGVGSLTAQKIGIEDVSSPFSRVGWAARDEVVHQHDNRNDIRVGQHGQVVWLFSPHQRYVAYWLGLRWRGVCSRERRKPRQSQLKIGRYVQAPLRNLDFHGRNVGPQPSAANARPESRVHGRPTCHGSKPTPHDALLPVDANNRHSELPSGVAIIDGKLHVIGPVEGGAPIEACEAEKAKFGLFHIVLRL